MPVLKDFQCKACHEIFEDFVASNERPPCPVCESETDTIYLKAPRPVGVDSFNPHYDMQLGQYFKSGTERKAFLERTGRQSDGHESPRKSTKTRVICSESQAKKLTSAENLKPGDL